MTQEICGKKLYVNWKCKRKEEEGKIYEKKNTA